MMLAATILAVLIGLSLGLLGGGGSILAVPLLVYVVGLGPRDAVATSVFVVGLASVAAMIPHALEKRVHARIGLPFGVASMVGAFVGGRLAHLLSEKLLLGSFTGVMAVTALAMMRRRQAEPEGEVGGGGGGLLASTFARASGIGIGIGLLTGIVGAGGGFVIVPALVLLCGLPMRAAVGTSLLVIAMNSFAAFAGAVRHASVPWDAAGAIAAAAVVGSLIGAALAKRVPAGVLRKGFAWFVLAMALFMGWKQLPRALTQSSTGIGVALGLAAAGAVVGSIAYLRRRHHSALATPPPSEART